MNSGDEWSVMNNLFSEGAADHSCALDTVFSPAGLLNVILRFWKLILLFVLLGGLAAWGLTRYVIKPVYRANATIYAWNNTQGANGNASTQEFYLVTQLMNDYRELLTSRRVQQPVEASLKTAFAGTFDENNFPKYKISVSTTRNTRIVSVAVESSSPQVAQVAANETTRVFADVIKEILKLDNVQMIDTALLPDTPVRPRMYINLLLGIFLGGLLGGALALLLEVLDRTLKDPEQAERVLNRTMVGAVPLVGALEAARKANEKRRTGLLKSGSRQVGEAFRLVRTNLHFLLSERRNGGRMVMLTSTVSGEGKSSCAAALAQVTAQSGKKVLLIDGDLRKSMQQALWGLDRSKGVVSIISGDDNFESAVYRGVQGEEKLDVLLAGPLPPNPSEMLMSENMAELLNRCRKEYDYIFIDAPPCLSIADPLVLGQLVDGVVFVVACNHTRIEAVRRTLAQLERGGIRLLGILLNKFNLRKSGYSYGYHYTDYGYAENNAADQTNGRDEEDKA